MGNSRFVKRLQKELPLWVEQGWVNAGSEGDILAHAAGQGQGGRFLSYAFGILGVLLLGSGVITYFAANWEHMARLAKLALLFGSMWGAFAAAGCLLADERSPGIGQALLLLGVILFGANIMLIAQIYHIDSHYPDGVLLWSLGGLLTAYIFGAQPALIAAMVLATLWTSMESFDFNRQIHWWFLPVWLSFLPLVYCKAWQRAQHVVWLSLLYWSFCTFINYADHALAGKLYIVQLYFLLYLALFLGGMLMATHEKSAPFAELAQRYGVLAVLASFFTLTFPDLHRGRFWSAARNAVEPLSAGWLIGMGLALALVAGLALWHRQRSLHGERPAYLIWGQGLIAATILLIVGNLFWAGRFPGITALAFNILLLAGVLWLIVAGLAVKDRFFINIAFVFFAMTLLARYFDTFWTLLNRSFFFMGGGLLLLGGGYLLERQRRKLNAQVRTEVGA